MSVVRELCGGNSEALILHTQRNGKEFVAKIPMNESSEKEIEENQKDMTESEEQGFTKFCQII